MDDDTLSSELLVGVVSEPLVEGKKNSGGDVVQVDGGELDKVGVDSSHIGREEIVQLSGKLNTLERQTRQGISAT